MKTTLLRLTNYKGHRNFEFKPGLINALIGGNGTGKTSVLDAFRSLADGGSEPDSIHRGEDTATIKWILELAPNDCLGTYPPGRYEITRTIKLDGYTLMVKNPKGVRIPKEKAFVEACLPKLGYDPIAFDKLNDEQRAEQLRDILKVRVTTAEIRAAASLVNLGAIVEEYFEDGVGAVDRIDAGMEETAKGLRAEIKALDGSLATFGAAIEGKSAEDVGTDLAAAKARVEALGDELAAKNLRIAESRDSDKEVANKEFETARNAACDWYDAEWAKLTAERDRRFKAAVDARIVKHDAIDAAFEVAKDTHISDIRNTLAATKAQVASLEEKQAEAQKLIGAREQVKAWTASKIGMAENLERITVTRQQLDRLRNKLLERMPLEGMQIKGGRLYIGGILSSEVNTATRILKWVEIATQYANDGQIIIVDDLEHLAEPTRRIFEDALREAGIQLIATIVDPLDGPLRVENTLLTSGA